MKYSMEYSMDNNTDNSMENNMENGMGGKARMETVPMGGASKEDLFAKNHPVIRELKEIPEIIFEEKVSMLPSSALPLKSLFARKQMDYYHVDSLILKKIARQVLHILTELAGRHICPGLIALDDLYVDMNNSQYGVFLLHPEKFQLLTFEQDYEWYPEDERIFGELTLFDENTQKIADNRLIYKILVASARGNVRIPPAKTEADYSELFYNILPEEWKQLYEEKKVCGYEELNKMLDSSIADEEEFARQTKESLDERAGKKEEKRARELQKKKDEGGEEQFDLFVILRTELDNSRKISRLLYTLQDDLETENRLLGHSCQQAFVFGNSAVQVKTFQTYPQGFRCQFPQTIREYSAGEALIIAADLFEEKIEELTLYTGRHDKKERRELRLYILLDGRVKNDKIFRAALKRLAALKDAGVKMYMRTVEDVYCEACQNLQSIVGGKTK